MGHEFSREINELRNNISRLEDEKREEKEDTFRDVERFREQFDEEKQQRLRKQRQAEERLAKELAAMSAESERICQQFEDEQKRIIHEKSETQERLEHERWVAEHRILQARKEEVDRLQAKREKEWETLNQQYPLPQFLESYVNKVTQDAREQTCFLNIGVLGNSGTGKSSLIKTIVERFSSEQETAPARLPVSCFDRDGTRAPTPYRLSGFHASIYIWELPGQGTASFPSKTYLRDMGLKYFDAVLITSDGRWTENDESLLRAIKFAGIWCIVVRTKIDQAVDDGENDHDWTHEETLEHVRNTLKEQLAEPIPDKLHLITTRKKFWSKFGNIDSLCVQLKSHIVLLQLKRDKDCQLAIAVEVSPQDSASQVALATHDQTKSTGNNVH
eukprot:TRINITY_DN21463_c0_g2_i1.p1 TRINITY_DN21463_c0_g2~~TRINITY_DN21463_c0_g2_i1.p1  ORF type:complete len:388 (-),score=62.68 TRINITY_DN21463_c0_g2_i1:1047-2210(-)